MLLMAQLQIGALGAPIRIVLRARPGGGDYSEHFALGIRAFRVRQIPGLSGRAGRLLLEAAILVYGA